MFRHDYLLSFAELCRKWNNFDWQNSGSGDVLSWRYMLTSSTTSILYDSRANKTQYDCILRDSTQ